MLSDRVIILVCRRSKALHKQGVTQRLSELRVCVWENVVSVYFPFQNILNFFLDFLLIIFNIFQNPQSSGGTSTMKLGKTFRLGQNM